MKQSITGLLGRLADKLEAEGDGGRAHALRTLIRNLRELRDRTEAGDTVAAAEFFQVYVFEDGAKS